MPEEKDAIEIHTKRVVNEDDAGVVPKSKLTFRKIMRLFSPEDPKAVAKGVMKTIVEPSIKKGIVDAVSMYLLNRPVFGNNPVTNAINSISSGTPYYLYGDATKKTINEENLPQPVSAGPRFDGQVFFKDPYTPRRVLEELKSTLAQYHRVSLLELYDCARLPGANYVSPKYGWKDLSSATIYGYADGYILELPPVMYIG